MSTPLPTTPDSREIARVRAQDSLTRCDERAASAARFGSREEQQADYAAAVAALAYDEATESRTFPPARVNFHD